MKASVGITIAAIALFFAFGVNIAYAAAPGVPNGMYGPCRSPTPPVRSKTSIVQDAAGANLTQIESIDVLDCHAFDGPGGSFVVPCPTETVNTYSYCVRNQNDGLGDSVLLGVVVNPDLPCKVTQKTQTPLPQIVVTFRDRAFGITSIVVATPANNANSTFVTPGDNLSPIFMVATKINRNSSATFNNVVVTNGLGITTTCSFSF